MFAVPAENFGLSPPTSTKSLPAVLGASCPTSVSSRTVDDRTLRGLQSRNHVDPAMDAEGGAEGNHVLRDIPQHAMSRILSSPRLSEIRGCHSQSRTFSSSAISFVSSGRKSVSMDSQFEKRWEKRTYVNASPRTQAPCREDTEKFNNKEEIL